MRADEADQIATMVLSQLEGALLLARTYRSLEPMQPRRAGVENPAASRNQPAIGDPTLDGIDLVRLGMGNGAQERTRTFTAVKPLAPEASASTNSATWARAG